MDGGRQLLVGDPLGVQDLGAVGGDDNLCVTARVAQQIQDCPQRAGVNRRLRFFDYQHGWPGVLEDRRQQPQPLRADLQDVAGEDVEKPQLREDQEGRNRGEQKQAA